jgi:hypothetical protein
MDATLLNGCSVVKAPFLAKVAISRGTSERVVLAALDHRPTHADEFARGRDDRDLNPPTRADAFKERPQRTRVLAAVNAASTSTPRA